MGELYLRAEMVNLDRSVYDTNDISTIRGGSFMLLEAVNSLEEKCKDFMEKISAGSSAGLFRILSGITAEKAVSEVKAHLAEKTGNHACFVVNTLERGNEDFSEIQEKLMAANRWEQMRQLSVPWGNGWKGGDIPCAIDGVRPGIQTDQSGGEKKRVSDSVDFRKKQGRKLRKNIYQRILGNSNPLPSFTDNMEELSQISGQCDNPRISGLDGKIAFVYADGNRFGKIRSTFCTDEKKLAEFDNAVQNRLRKPLLAEIIRNMQNDPHAKAEGKLRLETLLWGGDEIEWVVPAWKGWDLLHILFSQKEFYKPDWDQIPLTHAAGVIFCHHNAPILQIRKLAHALADRAKEKLSGQMTDWPLSHEEGDVFHYLVMESFDMLEGDPQTFLKEFYYPAEAHSLFMKGEEILSFSRNMQILRSGFPRGKLYEIMDALRENKGTEAIDRIRKRGLSALSPDQQNETDGAIDSLLGGDRHRWFVIADLWDYVGDYVGDYTGDYAGDSSKEEKP